jgi:hypothetical protein
MVATKKAAKKKAAKKKTPVVKKKKAPATATAECVRVAADQKAKEAKHAAILKEARAVLPKLRTGKVTLSAERDRLGHKSNKTLRAALTEILGSKEAYRAMMRKSMEERPQEKRSITKREVPWKPDDTDVPVVFGCKHKDGWSTESITVHLHTKFVLVAPDGTKYIEANSKENANLIVDHTKKSPELGRIRYRIFDNTSAAKEVEKEQKAATKRAAVKKAKRVRKKTKPGEISKVLDKAVARGEAKAAKKKKTTRKASK